MLEQTPTWQDGFKLEFVLDPSLNSLSAASKAEVVDKMLPYANNYLQKIITKTMSTRAYSLPYLAGYKCNSFNHPSIITGSTPFTKDIVILVGAKV